MIIALTFDIMVFAGSVPEGLLSSNGADEPIDVYVTTNTSISLILLSVGLLLIIVFILLIKKKGNDKIIFIKGVLL